jgi:UDP-N-acetylmuramoylalanine--D-glutamate ligase
MSETFNISGKHVAVFGAGRSGVAAAVLALREGAKVSIWDQGGSDKFTNVPAGVEIQANLTIRDAENFSADMIVLSPGIDTYSPLVQAFAAKTLLMGETEFASRFYKGGIIGITGTNGKTTTTELVARILKEAGKGGSPCGNYGMPLSEVVVASDVPSAVSLELSSFQLETIHMLHPYVSIWLNFAPDHMDRYPTVEAYKNAKLRIFENQTAYDTVIARYGEELGQILPKVITFSTECKDADFYSDGKTIIYQGNVILDIEVKTALRGLHNAENAMAAIAACMAYGIEKEVIMHALEGYAPPPHRCELIRTLDGVEYLNDSKATNLHALQCAIRSQSRPVVLIAGGKDKGLDYSEVIPYLQKQVLEVITFGEIAYPLAYLLGSVVPCSTFTTLEQATHKARSVAPRGSTVLLSPGTSSFDQFKGYEHRGNVFKEIVQQLH